MDDIELILLENILDSLDRVFDEDSYAIDVYVLIFATTRALAETKHFQILERTEKSLEVILETYKSKEDLREAALIETDELRHYIAELFPPFVNN